ncbi:hypothetical protein NMY22_g19613 [Coprinellus aureogranulatus]|nr:hypothetical protein NMY22_g19613 [Coprinellus aureogranulatus]
MRGDLFLSETRSESYCFFVYEWHSPPYPSKPFSRFLPHRALDISCESLYPSFRLGLWFWQSVVRGALSLYLSAFIAPPSLRSDPDLYLLLPRTMTFFRFESSLFFKISQLHCFLFRLNLHIALGSPLLSLPLVLASEAAFRFSPSFFLDTYASTSPFYSKIPLFLSFLFSGTSGFYIVTLLETVYIGVPIFYRRTDIPHLREHRSPSPGCIVAFHPAVRRAIHPAVRHQIDFRLARQFQSRRRSKVPDSWLAP